VAFVPPPHLWTALFMSMAQIANMVTSKPSNTEFIVGFA
jgi:hypothetical protein